MPRVKRGTTRIKKRKNLLAKTKGYRWGRKKLVKQAKTAIRKAAEHSFNDRREKKNVKRRNWQVQINAAVRQDGKLTYSKLINLLNKSNVILDRKILAELGKNHPEVFKKVVAHVSK